MSLGDVYLVTAEVRAWPTRCPWSRAMPPPAATRWPTVCRRRVPDVRRKVTPVRAPPPKTAE